MPSSFHSKFAFHTYEEPEAAFFCINGFQAARLTQWYTWKVARVAYRWNSDENKSPGGSANQWNKINLDWRIVQFFKWNFIHAFWPFYGLCKADKGIAQKFLMLLKKQLHNSSKKLNFKQVVRCATTKKVGPILWSKRLPFLQITKITAWNEIFYGPFRALSWQSIWEREAKIALLSYFLAAVIYYHIFTDAPTLPKWSFSLL